MFVLRRLTSQNVERNTVLGDSYLLIEAERNEEDFKRSLKAWGNLSDNEDIYAFVSYDEGSKLLPLYIKSTYFIMMSNGQTFANVTRRNLRGK